MWVEPHNSLQPNIAMLSLKITITIRQIECFVSNVSLVEIWN